MHTFVHCSTIYNNEDLETTGEWIKQWDTGMEQWNTKL